MKSVRKPSGGVRNSRNRSDKRLSWKGGDTTLTTIADSDEKARVDLMDGVGGTNKLAAKSVFYANVLNPNDQKSKKAQILSVHQNDANRLFTRRNIITKGALIRVKLDGSERIAKVSSRPGQDGAVNAILVEEKK
ncbi:MAG: 30S ribosomal protein S8e [Candidatus Diapherotrites archaeon]|uniref:30S ribosomal protein S8e n=1 Tax=Candidatus Iainarchaeum sp. TaxID=3101447 RepID=A0A7J4IVF8_9ARCH|nr:30S ribosomal protein S8e [Candidatus Diapherotrites archaeon]HIH08800.1 30S ribosomal protein S8e [Candidatus Diapherotrites archaeon]